MTVMKTYRMEKGALKILVSEILLSVSRQEAIEKGDVEAVEEVRKGVEVRGNKAVEGAG